MGSRARTAAASTEAKTKTKPDPELLLMGRIRRAMEKLSDGKQDEVMRLLESKPDPEVLAAYKRIEQIMADAGDTATAARVRLWTVNRYTQRLDLASGTQDPPAAE